MKKKTARRILEGIVCLVLLLAVALSVLIYVSYHILSVTHVTVDTQLDAQIRLAVISDLHDGTFGADNEKLISEIEREEPDLILILGDMLNGDSDDSGSVVELCRALDAVAPAYFALGNHEVEYMAATGEALVSLIESVGVPVLDLEYEDISVNGADIRLGGMYDYAFALDDLNSTKKENMKPEVYDFLAEFEDTDRYKIMLAHRPDSFVFGEASVTWDVDLVLSGHTHGGQVRIPFAGGLYAPDQGTFPKYSYGLYEKDLIKIFITRGLGSQPTKVPRINNLPEIAVIELRPGETET